MPQGGLTIRLGIPGLDEQLGGLPRGYIILLAGYPGSGKTTFASQFIYEGLRGGERGLYVSFVEPKEDFYRNSLKLGLDFAHYEARGLFRYYEALNVSTPEALSDLIQDVLTQVDSMGASRLAVDSVTAISQLAGDAPKVREIMHSALYAGLKRRGVTTVLIAELPVGTRFAGLGPEEFIADGVIVMKYRYVRGKMERYAEIRKMRGFNVRDARVPIALTDRGVVFPAPVSAASLASGLRPRRLIDVLGVKVPEGSSVLIAFDPSIDPLWVTVRKIVVPALRAGLKVSYTSYVHGLATIRHAVEGCLGEVPDDMLRLEAEDAVSLTAGEAESRTYVKEVDFGPDLVVCEGENVLSEFMDRDDYTRIIYRILLRRGMKGVTTVHLYAARKEDVWSIPLVKSYDYVMYLGRAERGLKLEHLKAFGSVEPPTSSTIEFTDGDCLPIH